MNTETLASTATKVITRIAALKGEGNDTLTALQVAGQELLDSLILNGLPATEATRNQAINFVTTVYAAAGQMA